MTIDNSNNAFDLFDDDDDIDFEDFDELAIKKDEYNEIVKEFDEAVAKNSVITTSAEQTLKTLEEYKNKKNNEVIKQEQQQLSLIHI